MKKLFVALHLLFPLYLSAQDYKTLRRQGDSLKFSKNYSEAVVAYDKCIDLILTGKQQVYNNEWNNLLASAMDANKSYPSKYSAMLYGTRAEKMSDKIATLKDMGVKYIFSFYSFTGGATGGYFSNWPYECNPSLAPTNILVWAINENVFMQAFDACNTYKPFKLNDSELYKLLKAHTDDLIKEKIKPMILKGHDGFEIFHFQFYADNRTIEKDPMDIHDFRPMEQNHEPIVLKIIKKETIDKGNDIYHSNIKTHLAQFFLRTTEDEKQYYNAISAGAERARVGKFD
jgi:hypothetical protein